MKAIVHIGTEKTGTTSIQRYLYLNRKKLSAAGYHFIQSAGETNNRALPAYCVADERFDDFFRAEGITTHEEKEQFKRSFINRFEAELQGLPKRIHTVLISSEHFHSRISTEAELHNVHALLSTYFDEIKVVCYLREQVATCVSYYSTHLKGGGIASFGKFLERCKSTDIYYNYALMLKNWESFFGFEALDVSLFAKDYFLNGNLLDDFTAKIDLSLVGTLNQNVELENESLRPGGQVLSRLVNLVFLAKPDLPDVACIREECNKLIASRMTGKGQQPDLETWKTFFDRFIECNEEVRQKYFPHLQTLFTLPLEIEPTLDVIDEEFSELLIAIFTLIKRERISSFMPQVYARLWTAISTCVNDVAGVQGVDFYEGRPPPVVLGDADAHMLKNVASNIEKRNPQAALKLMTLASRVKPQFPAIQKKLEEYRKKDKQKVEGKPKSKFILTYHATGEKPKTQKEAQQLNARCSDWLQSLNTVTGSALTPVKRTNTVKSDSIVLNETSSALAGYTVFHAESLEAALSVARECPLLEVGGTLEVSEIGSLWSP